MIKLLAKIFIKNYENYESSEVREKYGILCGGAGIFLNILLFIAKITGGTISASVAMVADAFNNLSDAASSIIQILGFKLSAKKPDPEHPYGHGRLEYISGLIISFLILLMGVELLKSSFQAILSNKTVVMNRWAVIIMLGAIAVKLYMAYYNVKISKKINSVAMKATAMDSLSDSIATAVVLLSFFISRFTQFPVDGIAGIVVAVFILYEGFSSAKETIEPLLGSAPTKVFLDELEEDLKGFDNIIGIHDLVVHDYGPGRLMISLHAEVPGNHSIFELHDSVDLAENFIAKKYNCSVVIHMDPIDTENHKLEEYKLYLKNNLPSVTPDLKAHDVRMVPGPTHVKLIFDVVKPISCTMEDSELTEKIQILVQKKYPDTNCSITVDQPYV